MPEEPIMNVPQELLILGAAVETGIIQLLYTDSVTLDTLTAQLKADKHALWVFVEALKALGYVQEKENWLSLTDKSLNLMYREEAKEYSGFAFMHRYSIIQSWIHLPEIIKTGKPFRSYISDDHTRYFMDAMRQGSKHSSGPIAEFLLQGKPEGARVLDIGGGPLFHAQEFAKRGALTYVLDLPVVCDLMKAEASSLGIQMIPGDFNEYLPDDQYDLAYLGNICHIISAEKNQELIKRIGKIMTPGGMIAIADFIRGTNPFAAVFGVNMLVNTSNGGTYTLEEYSDWLTNAGFENPQLHQIAERQIITGRKR